MAFVLTSFIHPLKKPIQFGDYWIDNPNEEEIKEIEKQIDLILAESTSIIKEAHINDNFYKSLIFKFHAVYTVESENPINFLANVCLREIVKNFCEALKIKVAIKNPRNWIAKNWVIIRYSDINIIKINLELNKAIKSHIALTKNEIKEKRDLEFKKFLDYTTESTVLNDKIDNILKELIKISLILNNLNQSEYIEKIVLQSTNHNYNTLNIKNILDKYHIFDEVTKNETINFLGNIRQYTTSFNKLFADSVPSKQIKLLCDYLEIIEKEGDNNSALLFLVSAIELLLTHKPSDNSEDSLSKQFVLKLSVLCHEDDKNINLQDYRSRFKRIYEYRSCIAHGNFKELYKLFQKHKGINFSDEILFMHKILKLIIQRYILDYDYVNFLKEN